MKKVLIGVSLFVFSVISFLLVVMLFGSIDIAVQILVGSALVLLVFFICAFFIFKNKDADKAQIILRIIKRILIIIAYYVVFIIIILFQINSNETTGGV